MAGVWDWALLDGCFGETKIKPTDIDGFVERNGRFLILETKAPGASIPQGQFITFQQLVRRAGAMVIVIWGTNNKVEHIKVFTGLHINGIDEDADNERLKQVVSAWFAKANDR